jgi:hypothetical protein
MSLFDEYLEGLDKMLQNVEKTHVEAASHLVGRHLEETCDLGTQLRNDIARLISLPVASPSPEARDDTVAVLMLKMAADCARRWARLATLHATALRLALTSMQSDRDAESWVTEARARYEEAYTLAMDRLGPRSKLRLACAVNLVSLMVDAQDEAKAARALAIQAHDDVVGELEVAEEVVGAMSTLLGALEARSRGARAYPTFQAS